MTASCSRALPRAWLCFEQQAKDRSGQHATGKQTSERRLTLTKAAYRGALGSSAVTRSGQLMGSMSRCDYPAIQV